MQSLVTERKSIWCLEKVIIILWSLEIYSNLASCHHNFGMRILRRDIDINCCNILLILNVTVFDETVEKLHFFVYLEKC